MVGLLYQTRNSTLRIKQKKRPQGRKKMHLDTTISKEQQQQKKKPRQNQIVSKFFLGVY